MPDSQKDRGVLRRDAFLFTLIALLLAPLATLHAGDRIWWDGTRENDQPPPGKLLSDNDGWWRDCILTGVEYRCESAPTSPADLFRNDSKKFGRRLLDGIPSGSPWVPVGQGGNKPLVVVFDFKRECVFGEVDVATRSQKVSVNIQCRLRGQDDWRTVLDLGRDACPDEAFHRLTLTDRPRGRYMRLSVQAQGITCLDEVWVWGDAEVSESTPEAFQPVGPTKVITGIAFVSVPGIEKTAFPDAQFRDWQRDLGADAKQPAVWSQVATWDSITDRPILPAPDQLARRASLVMARNETESAALALTNTSMEKPATLEVSLGEFRRVDGKDQQPAKLKGQLRVGGAIASRNYGVNIGPLFEADNLLGGSLMQRYLTNGAGIKDFPRVTLSPAGSAIFWVSVTSDGAEPGVYEAQMVCGGGPSVAVRAEVLYVTLPRPFVWLLTYSRVTTSFPFSESDRLEREVAYKQSLGVTVWQGFPTPENGAAALARSRGRTIHMLPGWPVKYITALYTNKWRSEDLKEEDKKAIADWMADLVTQAKALGLSYDDWFASLSDEPGRKNGRQFGMATQIIRRLDPNVHIYCNPSFWEVNDVRGDDDVYDTLASWYRENVDISVPFAFLLRDHPKSFALFDSPRFVRAFYNVMTQSAKSERAAQIECYRDMAWMAFSKGWNGWAFYSYYAPRGNPWNDFDPDRLTGQELPDYQMVYPGPRGPIPTRQSEAVREGWEDYCLLTLLKQLAPRAEVEALLKDYADGKGKPLPELRLRALQRASALNQRQIPAEKSGP